MPVTTPAREREYLTVGEVAAELKCSVATIRRRIRSGELPATRLGQDHNSVLRVRRDTLERWLRAAPHDDEEN